MRDLSSSDLLALWEQGHRLHPLDRGLLVLGAALPGTSHAGLADWPLGRRNEALVQVRCACFGTRLEGWAACVACGEKLELDVDGRTLTDETGSSSGEPLTVNGRTFRLPTSRDLAGAASATDPRQAAIRIAKSCLLEAKEPMTWPEEELEAIGESMAQADPMAEIELAMLCPICGYEGSATLDIIVFLWIEIEARVKRLLAEVHTLASAYGWGEGEILSLSEHRRGLYLDMVRG